MEKELTDEDPLAVGLGFFFGLIIGGLIGLLCGKLCIKDYARSRVSTLLLLFTCKTTKYPLNSYRNQT